MGVPGSTRPTTGETYLTLGDAALADSLLTASVSLLDSTTTPPLELGQAYNALARLRGAEGDLSSALSYIDLAHTFASRAVREGGPGLTPLDDRNLLLFSVMRDYSWLYTENGDTGAAVDWATRAVEMARGGGAAERNWGHAYQALGDALSADGRHGDAVEALRESVRLTEQAEKPDSSALCYNRNALALALAKDGQGREAVGISRGAVEGIRQLFGISSLRGGEALGILGTIYLLDGQNRAATAYLDSARVVLRGVGLGEIVWTGQRIAELAWAQNRLGESAAAEAAARDALRIAAANDDDALRALGQAQLGRALVTRGQRQEGRRHLRAALQAFAEEDPDAEGLVAETREALGA